MSSAFLQDTTRGEPFERFFSELGLSGCTSLNVCTGALAAVCLAGLAQQTGVTLFVCNDVERAKILERQVATWLGPRSNRVICMLPERTQLSARPQLTPK